MIQTENCCGCNTNRIIRRDVLGSQVDVLDMDKALEFVDSCVRNDNGTSHYIVAVNPEKVFAIKSNDFLNDFLANASLVVPDGIGVVAAIKLLYGDTIGRVPGADLMQEICARAPHKGYRIFIYGGKEEVNREAVEVLQEKHPGLQVVGRANGYVSEDEMPSLIRQINESCADILFVALGSPKQEQWLYEHLAEVNVRVCQGIGGTLDTIVGNVPRAPKFFQRCHLEWFYRLLKQPSRIKRQAILPLFAAQIIAAKIKMEACRLLKRK